MTPLTDILLLFPYYLSLKVRHLFYNKGIWKSKSYPVPMISVGNITVGGTGKTPHIEWLIRKYGVDHRLAVISRGYGRKTKGYREVLVEDEARSVGDEPLQIKRKFPHIRVVVDADRRRAIETLLAEPESVRPQLILLDDAFQHRAVLPQCSVVLVNYSRPLHRDHLLPLGRLRDLPGEIRRADVVVVTKYPGSEVPPEEIEQWRKDLRLTEDQPLFFSRFTYGKPRPGTANADLRYVYSPRAYLFTGIADDRPLVTHVRSHYQLVGHRQFSDHHDFTPSQWRSLERWVAKSPTAVVLTTEKDARRIRWSDVPKSLQERLFYIPIEAEIIAPFSEADFIRVASPLLQLPEC